MIPEPLQHPYEGFAKAEMKKLRLVQAVTIDLVSPKKELVFLYGQNSLTQQLLVSIVIQFDMASLNLKLH